jgi:hypothetical protein
MALVGDSLYIATTDAVVRVPYAPGDTVIDRAPVRVLDLPAGPRNHHWTKNIIASPDGSKLFIAIGSNSNVAEHGIEEEKGRAEVWELDLRTGSHRTFATGLRNPVGMAWEPESERLWVSVNERDELGNDLVPDYMTAVRDGGFYGWPYSYYGQHVDDRVTPQRPISWPRQSGRITRWGPTPPRWAWPMPRATGCPLGSNAGCSWGSTARGTENPGAATRSSSCHFATAGRRARPSTYCPASSPRTATQWVDPSALQSIHAAAYWLPTMSATWCGG